MFNPRLYRAAVVPVGVAVAVFALSLQGRGPAPSSSLAPDAFQGARAFAELQSLEARFPRRAPGSAGDHRLADYVAGTIRGLGGASSGGFTVRVSHFSGRTVDGDRQLENVVAERPGSSDAAPIVILAHRDAAAAGSPAELSGTAALLELARVFASRATRRTIVLVSTSGGSGGDAGAARFAAEAPALGSAGPLAVIVLGDLAGATLRSPPVVPYSDAYGSSSIELQRTVDAAIVRETGLQPSEPSTLGQLAHLAFPLALGEEGVLNASGVPSVLVQVSGERGPVAGERISPERLEGFGRAVLSSIDALDAAPEIAAAPERGLPLDRKLVPSWAVRLLGVPLLLGPLFLVVDGVARLRRRRQPVARGLLWSASFALPFLCCALVAYLLGVSGAFAAASAVPPPPRAAAFGGGAFVSLLCVVVAFCAGWVARRALIRRFGRGIGADAGAAGLGTLIVLLAVAVAAWIGNPYAALIALPAVHLWLLLADPGQRPRRWLALCLLALGLLPLIIVIAFYARQLGLGPLQLGWVAVLILAGGHLGVLGTVLWSLALGSAVAAATLCLADAMAPARRLPSEPLEVTIRGPLSYAGPGSLGGTPSALRR